MYIEIPNSLSKKEFEDEINKAGIENITELRITHYGHFDQISYVPNLEYLNCQCCNATLISSMKKLTQIICCFCPNISEIPFLTDLEKLYCCGTNISSIPHMEKLETLWCYQCPKLYEIPNLPNLNQLYCDDDLKIKFYNKKLRVNDKKIMPQYLQGRLYQNIYRTYELLVF